MRFSRLLCTTGIVLCQAIIAHAQTEVKVTGQIRLRHEQQDKDIRLRTRSGAFSILRTRAMAERITAGNTHIVIQFQESRYLATYGNSGGTTNAANVEIHQAYVQIDRMFLDGLGLRAGRFEFTLGNQRVFGASDWNNYGRAWEGGEVFYESPNVKWSGFWLEWYRKYYQRDRSADIYGVNTHIKPLGVEFTAFYLHDEAGLAGPRQAQWVHLGNLGTYWKGRHGQLDFELNGGYQFGEGTPLYPSSERTLDISAALLAVETGYTIPGSAKARLAAGIDATSGDGDGSDNVWHTFDNLYYSAHPFRGYMDYFSGSDIPGLIDLMARGRLTPITGWIFSGDLHYFTRAAEYTDFKQKLTRDVGAELDLGVKTDRVAGVSLAAGASAFLPTESFAGIKDPDMGWWFYTMATVNF